MFKSILASIGKALAHVGVAVVKGSVFVSKDPQVVQVVAGLAGHPEIGAAVIAGASAVNAGSAAVAAVKAGDVSGAIASGQSAIADTKTVVGAVQSLKK